MSDSLRLLLIEDNPGDAELVREYLVEAARDWNLEVAPSLSEAREALSGGTFDLILTDLGLPESRGIESFRAVRQAADETPVLVLTGTSDAELGRLAVAEGAQDYLVKGDLAPALLNRALDYAIGRHRLAREAERSARAARQADRLALMGRIVGGVAHEFNNLLTAMQGYAQLLQADPDLDEDQRECVDEILAAAQRAGGITRQLLAYSRRQILSPAPFDLNETIREMQALVESTLGRRFVLRIDLDPEPVRVLADRSQIEHAVMHLVTNARQAMPDGGTLSISTEIRRVEPETGSAALGPGAYGVIEVVDDGPGMPAEVLEHAHEPFFTARSFGEATGLGLATVDGIADQSGGALEIESSPGEGTAVRICLPSAEEAGQGPEGEPAGPGTTR